MSTAKKHRRKKPKVPASAARPRKIVVDFPEPLFRETENAVAELATTRSDFVRMAVDKYIQDRRKEKLKQELIEGYTANAAVARQIAEELAQFD